MSYHVDPTVREIQMLNADGKYSQALVVVETLEDRELANNLLIEIIKNAVRRELVERMTTPTNKTN